MRTSTTGIKLIAELGTNNFKLETATTCGYSIYWLALINF